MELLQEIFEVNDMRVFELLNSPVRQKMLRLLVTPRSVKALAETMGVPPTRLYYHMNQMRELGVITAVDERKVGAMVETIYQTTAHTFRPGPALLEDNQDPEAMARITAAVVFDPSRAEAEAALCRHFSGLANAENQGEIGRGRALMSPERAKALSNQVAELLAQMEEDDEDSPGAIEYALTLSFFPVVVDE